MNATPAVRLESLRGADLRALHANGTTPAPTELTGVIDGAVLTGRLSLPLVRDLGLWRGKVFDQDERGTVVGLNRLGVGPLEIRRYGFTARTAQSLFSDRDVIFLDHDNPENRPMSGASTTSSSRSRAVSTWRRPTTEPGNTFATCATPLWPSPTGHSPHHRCAPTFATVTAAHPLAAARSAAQSNATPRSQARHRNVLRASTLLPSQEKV